MGFNRSLIQLPKLRDCIFYFSKEKNIKNNAFSKTNSQYKIARIYNHEYTKPFALKEP
jgi:hypothetical protein